MDSLIFLKLFSFPLLLFFTTPSKASICKSAKCTTLLSPQIQPPFRIQGIHPHQCGLSEFTLFCNHQNQTTIRFHGTTDLIVKSISYEARRLSLIDPQGCVHGVFLNLNLSHTPFSYYHTLRRYKYLNCSSEVAGMEAVPCLSGEAHHVYVVEPSLPPPASCRDVGTVGIPFSYSRYLSSDGSFGLGLTWTSARLDETDYNHTVIIAVLSMMAVVWMAGKVLYAKYGSKENEEGVNLLGEYRV
ncbi:RING-H2 finger protein ATL22-like [Salvia divinorum]|uniref:RING-type E3 ubiquitin transferase n=1 Tax=Salvia divinorum TaxID=28513 RepID=A0ABD1GYC8_SALDI